MISGLFSALQTHVTSPLEKEKREIFIVFKYPKYAETNLWSIIERNTQN